jgi:hypothetical protein
MTDTLPSTAYLIKQFGKIKTVRMLEFALPHIYEHEKNIRQALANNDLQATSNYAHKALSPVRLYGTEKLEQLLLQIKDNTMDNHQAMHLQQATSAEFNFIIKHIETWLNNAKNE